jgi:hypothetical protein
MMNFAIQNNTLAAAILSLLHANGQFKIYTLQ